MNPVILNPTPDKPICFGPKNKWIAVKCDGPKDLAIALKLKEIQPANWKSGVNAAYAYGRALVFVTPPINSWVLAVGGLPDPSDPSALAIWRQLMTQVSLQFGEAQFFATYRVSSYTAWSRYINGEEKRLFLQGDEPVYSFGNAFPDEAELLSQFFDSSDPEASNEGYWSRRDLRFPREADVFTMAKLWSIDPTELESRDLPHSSGLVGHLTA